MSEGIFIVGRCIGFRNKEKVDKSTGAVSTDLLLGLAVPKEGGFEGETDTFSIKVKDEMRDPKLLELYVAVKGKTVMVPVRPFAYGMRGDSAGISWSLAGDGKPVPVAATKPAAA